MIVNKKYLILVKTLICDEKTNIGKFEVYFDCENDKNFIYETDFYSYCKILEDICNPEKQFVLFFSRNKKNDK